MSTDLPLTTFDKRKAQQERQEQKYQQAMAEPFNELPKAVIVRLLKESLPDHVNIAKDTKTVLGQAARVFITYVASSANDFALENKRKVIAARDVFEALEDLNFGHMVEPLKDYLDEFKATVESKKAKRAARASQAEQEQEASRQAEPNPDEEPNQDPNQEQYQDQDQEQEQYPEYDTHMGQIAAVDQDGDDQNEE
eukprot:m.264753 g.264753  ORF g.264753 m.264753 type:complete len:196 (+) comp28202_c1_seq1:70-657(+)